MAVTLSMPFQVSTTGALVSLVQDSPADISQSITTLLSTIVGERAALPGYGITDPLGQVEVDEAEIAQAIAEWDDRVDDADIEQILSTVNGAGFDAITVEITSAAEEETTGAGSIPISINEPTDGILDGGTL